MDAAPFGVAAIRGADLSPVTDDLPTFAAARLDLRVGPNPFNPRRPADHDQPNRAAVTLEVLDVRGHRVDEIWRGT